MGNEADGVAKVGDDLKLRHAEPLCCQWFCQAQLRRMANSAHENMSVWQGIGLCVLASAPTTACLVRPRHHNERCASCRTHLVEATTLFSLGYGESDDEKKAHIDRGSSESVDVLPLAMHSVGRWQLFADCGPDRADSEAVFWQGRDSQRTAGNGQVR